MPITKQLKFSAELAYGQALGVEFFRYGQDRNLGTGSEVRTLVGWGELDYAHDRDTTFIAGYGFDNPSNSDCKARRLNCRHAISPQPPFVFNRRAPHLGRSVPLV